MIADAVWWNERRLSAFELVREGRLKTGEICKKVGISPRSLRGWQTDAHWRKRLVARDSKVQAALLAAEIGRLSVLEQVCTAAIEFWSRVLSDPLANDNTCCQAARDAWALKLKLEDRSRSDERTERFFERFLG